MEDEKNLPHRWREQYEIKEGPALVQPRYICDPLVANSISSAHAKSRKHALAALDLTSERFDRIVRDSRAMEALRSGQVALLRGSGSCKVSVSGGHGAWWGADAGGYVLGEDGPGFDWTDGERFLDPSEAILSALGSRSDVRSGKPTLRTMREVQDEVSDARSKFPGNQHRLAAMMEEVGETANAFMEGKPWEEVRAEAKQAACTAIRIMEEGDSSFPIGPPQSESAHGELPEDIATDAILRCVIGGVVTVKCDAKEFSQISYHLSLGADDHDDYDGGVEYWLSDGESRHWTVRLEVSR